MKIKEITYPTDLSEINDIFNDNIDVFVETDDGMIFTMTVSTPLYYLERMEKEELGYIPACPPDVIVKELTHETIFKAIESYCRSDGYWMKAYFWLGTWESMENIKKLDNELDQYTRLDEID